jgi:hypothetical protein
MTPTVMRSHCEEDEMARSLLKRSRVAAVLVIAAPLGLLPLAGCENPGTIPPIAHRRTADLVQKVRRGVDPSKVKGAAASPEDSGKPAPGRGRAMD